MSHAHREQEGSWDDSSSCSLLAACQLETNGGNGSHRQLLFLTAPCSQEAIFEREGDRDRETQRERWIHPLAHLVIHFWRAPGPSQWRKLREHTAFMFNFSNSYTLQETGGGVEPLHCPYNSVNLWLVSFGLVNQLFFLFKSIKSAATSNKPEEL